jgi:hypothetical protein
VPGRRPSTLSVNDRKVAEGRIDRTQPMAFSADETADADIDEATPVVEGLGEGRETRFTGRIDKATVEVKLSGEVFFLPLQKPDSLVFAKVNTFSHFRPRKKP